VGKRLAELLLPFEVFQIINCSKFVKDKTEVTFFEQLLLKKSKLLNSNEIKNQFTVF
jgi:hypothetical protein